MDEPLWQQENHEDEGDDKPPMDYKTMVMMALQSCTSKDGLTICQIYDYIIENFAYYRYACRTRIVISLCCCRCCSVHSC
jgi:hypothetical protein